VFQHTILKLFEGSKALCEAVLWNRMYIFGGVWFSWKLTTERLLFNCSCHRTEVIGETLYYLRPNRSKNAGSRIPDENDTEEGPRIIWIVECRSSQLVYGMNRCSNLRKDWWKCYRKRIGRWSQVTNNQPEQQQQQRHYN